MLLLQNELILIFCARKCRGCCGELDAVCSLLGWVSPSTMVKPRAYYVCGFGMVTATVLQDTPLRGSGQVSGSFCGSNMVARDQPFGHFHLKPSSTWLAPTGMVGSLGELTVLPLSLYWTGCRMTETSPNLAGLK